MADLNWDGETEPPQRQRKSRKFRACQPRVSDKLRREIPDVWAVDEFYEEVEEVLALDAAGPGAMRVSGSRGFNGIFHEAGKRNGHKCYKHANGAIMCFEHGWKIQIAENSYCHVYYCDRLGIGPPIGVWWCHDNSSTCNVTEGPKEVFLSTNVRSKAPSEWQSLQQSFLRCNESQLMAELGPETWFTPVCPKTNVQKRFLAAGGTVIPAYHGTSHRNISAISNHGLLLPGHKGVRVLHGQAHGRGIYTAKIGSASLSQDFCDSNKMFVCAVKPGTDEEPEEKNQTIAGHQAHRLSDSVLHVGDAMVVSSEACVAPLFVAHMKEQIDANAALTKQLIGPMQRYVSMTAWERGLLRRQDQHARARMEQKARRNHCKYEGMFSQEHVACAVADASEPFQQNKNFLKAAPASMTRQLVHDRRGTPNRMGLGRNGYPDPFDTERKPAPCIHSEFLDSLENLTADITADLQRRPRKLVALASASPTLYGTRYNKLAHGGKRMKNGSFGAWLCSIPGVPFSGFLLDTSTIISYAKPKTCGPAPAVMQNIAGLSSVAQTIQNNSVAASPNARIHQLSLAAAAPPAIASPSQHQLTSASCQTLVRAITVPYTGLILHETPGGAATTPLHNTSSSIWPHYCASVDVEEIVPGLAAWLSALGLDLACQAAAQKWVCEQGACDLSEILENFDDFAANIGVTRAQIKLLQPLAKAAADSLDTRSTSLQRGSMRSERRESLKHTRLTMQRAPSVRVVTMYRTVTV